MAIVADGVWVIRGCMAVTAIVIRYGDRLPFRRDQEAYGILRRSGRLMVEAGGIRTEAIMAIRGTTTIRMSDIFPETDDRVRGRLLHRDRPPESEGEAAARSLLLGEDAEEDDTNRRPRKQIQSKARVGNSDGPFRMPVFPK